MDRERDGGNGFRHAGEADLAALGAWRMAGDFLPRREAEWLAWSAIFRDGIAVDPQAVALTQAQVDRYIELDAAFREAFWLASKDATRTPIAVRQKRETMAALEAEIRMLAGIIRSSPEVSTATRAALGLSTQRPGGRRPVIGAPSHGPSILIESVLGRTVNIRLLNTEQLTRRGRPIGVGFGRVWLAVGDTPPESLKQWQFYRDTRDVRTAVRFSSKVPVGTRVWICAQWISPTGKPGPAAKPATTCLYENGIEVRLAVKAAA